MKFCYCVCACSFSPTFISTQTFSMLKSTGSQDECRHILPTKAIHRAWREASQCQRDITIRPQAMVSETMPRTMNSSVVIHSGGSCGGVQFRSRPWMVWHCRTKPTVREPGWGEGESMWTQWSSHRNQGLHHLLVAGADRRNEMKRPVL